jgi:hypothetical protein
MVRSTPGARALSVLAAAVLIVALIALLVNVFRGGDDTAEPTTTLEPTTTTIADISQVIPTEVEASARLSDGFGESNLIDGDLETEWQVNQGTSPLTLEFRFAQPVSIRYLEIYNIADQDRFLRNYRIEGYKITVDDLPGVEPRATLKDLAGGPQRIDIASIETTVLTLEVLTRYPSQAIGDQPAFEELAVAEVEFWGTAAG